MLNQHVGTRIPFMRLDRQFATIRDPVLKAVADVLETGRVLQGPEITELEARLAQMHQVRHGVAVSSGTDALILAVASLQRPAGSRVAVPALSFVASAAAIVLNGARPVFVDVDPRTMLMDIGILGDLVRARQVDAVVGVHLYGQMLNLEELVPEARERGIKIVEDAAQTLGATRFGRPPGAVGDVACLSFDPMKAVGAYGSGGVLLTDDDDIARIARMLRYHGRTRAQIYERAGYNCQMHSVQAAIINLKLDYLELWQARRSAIAARFATGLARVPRLRLLETLPGNVHNFHKFVIRVPDRDHLQERLGAAGIETKVHYTPPLHWQPCFADGSRTPVLPQAEAAAREVLSLPIYPELTGEEADFIIDAIGEASVNE